MGGQMCISDPPKIFIPITYPPSVVGKIFILMFVHLYTFKLISTSNSELSIPIIVYPPYTRLTFTPSLCYMLYKLIILYKLNHVHKFYLKHTL